MLECWRSGLNFPWENCLALTSISADLLLGEGIFLRNVRREQPRAWFDTFTVIMFCNFVRTFVLTTVNFHEGMVSSSWSQWIRCLELCRHWNYLSMSGSCSCTRTQTGSTVYPSTSCLKSPVTSFLSGCFRSSSSPVSATSWLVSIMVPQSAVSCAILRLQDPCYWFTTN